MQKRKYTQLKAVEGLILSMREDGMTLQEIADELGISLEDMFIKYMDLQSEASLINEMKLREQLEL